jgi:hypothetical protein
MKRKPDRKYLAWLHELPCSVCEARPVEAHHDRKGMGMAQRAPDRRAIPLCPAHHNSGPEAIHQLGRDGFQRRFQLDVDTLIVMLNQEYDERGSHHH